VSVHWHVLPDRNAATHAACSFVQECLEAALASRPQATLAISGGSLPRSLFHHLGGCPVPWERIHLFWVDERCVPPDHPDSNYRLARESLLEAARIPEGNIHRIAGEREPEEAAGLYQEDLRRHFGLGPGALPSFDVVHLGLGADCHTASLFPGEPLISDRAGLAAPVLAARLNSWRVTLLPGVLLAARHALFFTAGAEKAAAVAAVRSGPYDPLRFPAQVVAREHPDVAFFLDEAAGAGPPIYGKMGP
jgi:6-phosphogluconolactonase